MRKFLLAVVASLTAAVAVHAFGLSGLIINAPGLAYSKRFSFNLPNAGVNTVSATATYSSATFSASTFSTGQVSTGSVTIASNTQLSSGTATEQITVISTSGAVGDSLVVTKLNKPGAFVFRAGRDWNYGATTALTAESLRKALATIPDFATSRSGAVLYSTATAAGPSYNAMLVSASNTGTMTVAHATFTGGKNATTVSVNGYAFQAGVQFPIGTTATNSATNLAAAINARARLNALVAASPSGAVVSLQSAAPGSVSNFGLATSNSAGISVLHPTMTGGANESWALNGKNITVSAHGYSLALPLLYGQGSAPAIDGLTDQTTYYAIPVDANTLKLATSSNNALAGLAIVLASSSTLTVAETYALTPLAFSAGSAGFDWEVSNDGVIWTPMAVSSVTYTAPGTTSWDLGKITPPYLSLNFTGPTAGGINLQVTASSSFTP